MEKKYENVFEFSEGANLDKLKKASSDYDLEQEEEDCSTQVFCQRKSTLQKFSKEVFIKRLQIVDFSDKYGHVSYYIAVRGRTKYLVNLHDLISVGLINDPYMIPDDNNNENSDPKFQMVEYCIVKRYSELLTFHKILQQEMKNYMKKKGFKEEDFPIFPPKKVFNKSKNFVERRIALINAYFEELFSKFPEKIPYTNALIDLCQPFKLNIAVIGQKDSGKSSLIQNIVYTLAEYQIFKETLKKQNWDESSQSERPLEHLASSEDFTFKMPMPMVGDPLLQKSQSDTVNIAALQGSAAVSESHSQTSKKGKKDKNKLKEQQRAVTKLVFNKQKTGDLDSTLKVTKKVESYFPLDVAFEGIDGKNLLFRLDIQEYQIDENDLKSLLSHIIQSDEKNAIMFTFDMTNQTSFKVYLKKAIKELIFAYEDLPQDTKDKRMIPFMLIGNKNDNYHKQRVNKQEIRNLLTVLQKHVMCDLQYTQTSQIEDSVHVLKSMFDLASSLFFYEVNNTRKQSMQQ